MPAYAAAASLVVIGNFDGVHVGHQAVLSAVGRLARRRELKPRMLTFEPHPAVTLGREPPAVLTCLPRKTELVERHCPGIEVEITTFSTEFARQSPEQFVRRVLCEQLGAQVVMVGFNFRFGHERSGSFADLESFGRQLGFEAIAEPLVSDAGGPCSSSRVRDLVATGKLEGVREMLGRPHMLTGQVSQGDQRGRTLGFPTCNLPTVPEALPPLGVYAVLVDLIGSDDGQAHALAKGVANIGFRPTVKPQPTKPLVEVHLFDLERNLYDRHLRVHLVAPLRQERRFTSLAQLKEQIGLDCQKARQHLDEAEPDPAASGAWA